MIRQSEKVRKNSKRVPARANGGLTLIRRFRVACSQEHEASFYGQLRWARLRGGHNLTWSLALEESLWQFRAVQGSSDP